jgi:hypothetical protein
MESKSNIETHKKLCINAAKKLKININKLNKPVVENYPPSEANKQVIKEFLSVTSNGV